MSSILLTMDETEEGVGMSHPLRLDNLPFREARMAVHCISA